MATSAYTPEDYRMELTIMIKADMEHLARAEAQGDTQSAARFRRAISDNRLELEDLANRRR